MKEAHKSMDHLLSAVNCQEHKWLLCGDIKVVVLVQALQCGYTKYPCFLSLWGSQADDQHDVRQEWPLRQGLNIQSHPFVEPNKILLPSLHIKLEMMKNFVMAIDREGCSFAFLQENIPRISMEKSKASFLTVPKQENSSLMFDEALSEAELSAWLSLKLVLTNFPGNHWSAKYKKRIEEQLKSFRQLGARMAFKLYFLRSNSDYFPKNCADLSEEQGECFH